MTLSLTWKVSSCVFLFLLVSFFPPSHYYFPLLSLSFPILVPFLLLFFDSPAELSVFLRCLPISSLFCAICVSELCFQFYSSPSEPFGGHREQLGSRPALAVPGGSRAAFPPVADVPWLLLGSVSSMSPGFVPWCHLGVVLWFVCNAGKEKLELQLLTPL